METSIVPTLEMVKGRDIRIVLQQRKISNTVYIVDANEERVLVKKYWRSPEYSIPTEKIYSILVPEFQHYYQNRRLK